jgi:hypothetical protein
MVMATEGGGHPQLKSTMGWGTTACIAGGSAVCLIGLLLMGAKRLGNAIYDSIGPLPPTARQLKEEDLDAHPLFRHLAVLKGKVAWRQIGAYPTPVHTANALTPDGANVTFLVRRRPPGPARGL